MCVVLHLMFNQLDYYVRLKSLIIVMTTVTTKAVAKVAAVATGLAMATSMLSLAPIAHAAALTSSQIDAVVNMITAFGADAATVANVRASLTGGTPSTTTTTTTSGGS